ncbi:MAG: Gfo/Idh/MocA family oxidoreductase [Bacteroidetes bacterium]|jgi:predicted dehydrogenase|nr:Gfo/Idh/MocA family oxidoreductase [Bacteroidota bacterium]
MEDHINIGLFGYGHLGRIHAKCIQAVPHLTLIGVFDPNVDAQKKAASEGIKVFSNTDELLEKVEAVDIVSPTPHHYEIARKALERNLHVFVEKPMTYTLEEAQKLKKLVKAQNRVLQVGHVERFNPAFLSLKNVDLAPRFIEGHRLATFNPRGTDVSVVLDLMIHDLDMILHLIPSPVADVQSQGIAIVSQSHDICNARITFENGAVANLTASRISLKQMRKLRLFQSNAYISMDFLDRSAEIVRLADAGEKIDSDQHSFELDTYNGKKHIVIDVPRPEEVNAIKQELVTFGESIANGTSPHVSVNDGAAALALAYEIMEKNDKQDERH